MYGQGHHARETRVFASLAVLTDGCYQAARRLAAYVYDYVTTCTNIEDRRCVIETTSAGRHAIVCETKPSPGTMLSRPPVDTNTLADASGTRRCKLLVFFCILSCACAYKHLRRTRVSALETSCYYSVSIWRLDVSERKRDVRHSHRR
jgi:hypothetical protein